MGYHSRQGKERSVCSIRSPDHERFRIKWLLNIHHNTISMLWKRTFEVLIWYPKPLRWWVLTRRLKLSFSSMRSRKRNIRLNHLLSCSPVWRFRYVPIISGNSHSIVRLLCIFFEWFRWVHEFLNSYNNGLDVLLDYLMTSIEVMR